MPDMIVIPTEAVDEIFLCISVTQTAEADGARPPRRNDGGMLVIEISCEGVSERFKKCHELDVSNAL